MHNKILSKFNKTKIQNLNNHFISINFLHRLFYVKKSELYHRGSSILPIGNLILLFLSFITIVKCKIFNVKIANYMIVHNGQLGKFDNRAKYILENVNLKKNINIIRCTKFKDSIFAYLRYPNVILYFPLVFFNEPRFQRNFSTIKNYYNFRHKVEILNYELFKKIFNFLKIKFFISIDDQRTIQLFLKICKDLNIYSIGYMHYKFSKFVIGIKYLTFDAFFVWSNYFFKKLCQVNKKYQQSKIFYTGFYNKKFKKINTKEIIILYLMDSDVKLSDIKKIISIVIKNKNLRIFFKFKPQYTSLAEKKIINFLIKKRINYFRHESLDQINEKIKFDFFLASISTALLEAPLYGAIPLKLCNKNDFADDLILDKVVMPVNNISSLSNILKKKPKIKELSNFKNKIWGLKKMKKEKLKKILTNLLK
jgi:hypothetical protein